MPLCYRMYFGEYLSFSGTLDCLRADIVDSDTAKDRKSKRARRYFVKYLKIHTLAKEWKLGLSFVKKTSAILKRSFFVVGWLILFVCFLNLTHFIFVLYFSSYIKTWKFQVFEPQLLLKIGDWGRVVDRNYCRRNLRYSELRFCNSPAMRLLFSV